MSAYINSVKLKLKTIFINDLLLLYLVHASSFEYFSEGINLIGNCYLIFIIDLDIMSEHTRLRMTISPFPFYDLLRKLVEPNTSYSDRSAHLHFSHLYVQYWIDLICNNIVELRELMYVCICEYVMNIICRNTSCSSAHKSSASVQLRITYLFICMRYKFASCSVCRVASELPNVWNLLSCCCVFLNWIAI